MTYVEMNESREFMSGFMAARFLPHTDLDLFPSVRARLARRLGGTEPLMRMPAIFAAHGAPVLLDDAVWMGELAAWAKAMPRPQSILMISAHWEQRPATLGATRTVPLVYDFYGFPEQYYRTRYAAPGAPGLAARVRDLLRGKGIACADDPARGLDHGAYVPLVAMYPAAEVPVLQMSMPRLDAAELFELGRALAPLRDEGVLVFGSGFLTHNMAYAFRPGIPLVGAGVRPLGRGRVVAPGLRVARRFSQPRPGGADGPAHVGALRAGSRRGGSRCRRAAAGQPSRSPVSGWTGRSRSGRSSSADGSRPRLLGVRRVGPAERARGRS